MNVQSIVADTFVCYLLNELIIIDKSIIFDWFIILSKFITPKTGGISSFQFLRYLNRIYYMNWFDADWAKALKQ